MNTYIDVHILQNFPFSRLNCGETGLPKDGVHGGYVRDRLSSQCQKRAMRLMAETLYPPANHLIPSVRTKRLLEMIVERLQKKGHQAEESKNLVRTALEGSSLEMTDDETNVVLFLGHDEVDRVANELHNCWNDLRNAAKALPSVDKEKDRAQRTADERRNEKDKKNKALPESIRKAMNALLQGTRALSVATYGRMVTEKPEMTTEAAVQVAHALSIGAAVSQPDFWTVKDDLRGTDEPGAGRPGTTENSSPFYYRYANMDYRRLLKNLGGDEELGKIGVSSFINSCVRAIPSGGQSAAAAQCLPSHVMVVVRNDSPVNLVNAFAAPIMPMLPENIIVNAIKRLDEYDSKMRKMYGEKAAIYSGFVSEYKDGGGSLDEVVKKVMATLP